MLTYTDCVELKEAGFPQVVKEGGKFYEADGNIWTRSHEVPYQSDELSSSCTLVPSLEELIEVCGIHFYSLTSNLESKWTVLHENGTEYIGSSPIQAVKNLYCALNKK